MRPRPVDMGSKRCVAIMYEERLLERDPADIRKTQSRICSRKA